MIGLMKTRRSKRRVAKVSKIPYDARALLTVRRGLAKAKSRKPFTRADIEGRLVRYEPAAGDTAHDTEVARAKFLEFGAVAVKILPPPPGEQIVTESSTTASSCESIRAVVLEKVDGTKNSRDKDALRTYLEEKMDEAGL